VRVLTEACNTKERPGFFLATPEDMVEAIDRADHANLAMQYDVYHMTMMGIDVPETLVRYAPRIGHVQFANVPGRHEPGSGTIDFDRVFGTLDVIGYSGYAAAEYRPSGPTEETLGWLTPYLG
jgi:hydroxypyruvate isomerase